MITLKNDIISLEISTLGAEIKKITVNGEERLWNGDPAFWESSAPILFPICGGLPQDKFTYGGKEYTLPKHGFARTSEFKIEKLSDSSVALLLTSSEETLKSYPWNFEFRVIFKLRGKSVDITYSVKNTSSNTMYLSMGAHEAYACPEGIEEYDVIFEKKESLDTCGLEGNLIAHSTSPIIKDTDTLPLYNSYFKIDALIFKDLKSRSATLRNRKTGKSVILDFNGFDYFLIWTKPNAPYVCLEPWAGIPPMVDAGLDITEKEGINALDADKTFTLKHIITF